ncbi:MAG: hypothetical protein GTO55_10885 [Armatimonadetes bacterium]|nr:hypothetical protein [Armatimonadota bacterium]NIM24735.1 hypothetical protein [Armatimonadota bacterium]NIM68615.1 hypothetical protein [Armatimonadota bacterium]NIM77132.1 hypothetical protein [Armatimonadota bacterium]NIN06809.1 hypothetical protein [Armatimonadota bacterium]
MKFRITHGRTAVVLCLGAFLITCIMVAVCCPATVCSHEAKGPLWDELHQAHSLLQEGGTQEARRLAEWVLNTPDLDAETRAYAHYILGTAAQYEGDVDTARVHYQEQASIAGMDWPGPDALDLAAHCLLSKRDYPVAVSEYAYILEEPAMPMELRAGACYQIGDILHRQERYVESLDYLHRIFHDFPDSSWTIVAQQKAAEVEAFLTGRGISLEKPTYGAGAPPPRSKIWASPDQNYWVTTTLYITPGRAVYFRASDFLRQVLPDHDWDTVSGLSTDQWENSLKCEWDFNYTGTFDVEAISNVSALVLRRFEVPGWYTIKMRINDVSRGTSADDTPVPANNSITIIVRTAQPTGIIDSESVQETMAAAAAYREAEDYDAEIELLKPLVAVVGNRLVRMPAPAQPALGADPPSSVLISPAQQLGMAYWAKGEAANALPYLETAATRIPPESDSTLPGTIIRCRWMLAEEGETLSPACIINGVFVEPMTLEGHWFVPAEQLTAIVKGRLQKIDAPNEWELLLGPKRIPLHLEAEVDFRQASTAKVVPARITDDTLMLQPHILAEFLGACNSNIWKARVWSVYIPPQVTYTAAEEMAAALALLEREPHRERGNAAIEEAMPHLRAALEKANSADERAQINLLLGIYHQFLQQYDTAIECAEQVMAHNPDLKLNFIEQRLSHISPRAILAHAYVMKEDWPKAVDASEAFLKRSPDAPVIHYILARARRALTESQKVESQPVGVESSSDESIME